MSKNLKTFVGLNFYGSDNGFYCGYVIDYNEEFVVLQHFSKYGMSDGLLTHKLADIKYFETDTDYIKGIEHLAKSPNAVFEQTYQPKSGGNDFTEGFPSLLENFIGNKVYIIKFELNDDEVYYGLIDWCDENYFTITNIDPDGLITGKATFKFEDLKLYWVDDLDCRKRKILYDVKYPGR
ncbi:hypothetical protein ASG01_14745 [Chryseobacterium sp. Leaf180]|nr:hypothetical protein ASG01_14745 [Chryseobacterium sp. Leaf180]